MKKQTKKTSSNTPVTLGLAGLAVAGLAGAYFLYGKDGAKNRKKITTWTLRAKADVLEKLEKAKQVSQESFHAAVDEVSARYGAKMKDLTTEDITLFAKDLKKHWKDIAVTLTPKAKPAVKKVDSKKKPAVKK